MLAFLKAPKIIGGLLLTVFLSVGYWNWKDDIEDALLAQVQLAAMKESEHFKQEKYAQAQALVKDLEVQKRSYELSAGILANELRSKSNENSCLVYKFNGDDVRLLNDTFVKDRGSPSPSSSDSPDAAPSS